MISRALRRALLDCASPLPPTYLLPWTAKLSTVAPASPSATDAVKSFERSGLAGASRSTANANSDSTVTSRQRSEKTVESESTKRPITDLSPSVRELLPFLQAQAPHYITIHIHGFPYLVTEGDIIRLPFLMPRVQPGDTIRLDRAVNLGSRDFTLGAPSPEPGVQPSLSNLANGFGFSSANTKARLEAATLKSLSASSSPQPKLSTQSAPHYIPHIAQGKHAYLDERLFVCRATVMGVESEPMRFKEKTKRRQRHVRTVKSKHRHTIIRISELQVRSLEEIEQSS